MKKDIWFVSPILSKTFIAITAKHADSGELTSFCMAVGGTACCCPTGYTTFITRPYMDFASKEDCPRWFHQMKAIWKDRDVVFIEGEKSRLGVGNDLFDNVKSIRRILCPPRDAFDRYEEILNEAQKLEKTALFLIALGPTATVLAYDLFKSGYQAIDAGHVDVEYEWWRMGAKRKVKLERKYVNEAANGKQVSDAGEFYRKQIIAKIY